MKVLFCFLDMLRPDLLSLYGNKYYSNVDKYLEQLGGTVFLNCYTPGPDTPRSTACMITGLYPKKNGCNARVKYPEFFLKEDVDNLFNLLVKNNIKLHFYLDKYNRDIGFLPKGFNKEEYIKGSDLIIQEYLKFFKPEENSFNFFYFPDFHNVVMDNAYSLKTPKKGLNKIYDILKILDNNIDYTEFDYIFFVSDHGYTLKTDLKKNVLDSHRSKIFLFIHKKGDTCITYNNKLCSTLDFLLTITKLFEVPSIITEGYDLFSEKQREYVLLEDHSDFSVNIHQSIEKYGVITPTNKYFTDVSGGWVSDDKDFTQSKKEYYEKLLQDNMTDYDKNRFLFERLQFYKRFPLVIYNSDGTLRKKSLKLRIKESKVFKLVRKIIYPLLRIFI